MFVRVSAGCRTLLNHELSSRQFRKTASFRYQFVERSGFDHAPAVKQQNARGVANRRQPMGDDERGSPLHDLVESGIDFRFGNGVERAGRLIENQDWRIL